MWSHYAEDHMGFCLEFKTAPLVPFYVTRRGRGLFEVVYQDSYPRTDVLRLRGTDELLNAVLLTKARFWEYELEWRIIEYNQGPGIYQFPEDLLSGVILGCQMPEETKMRSANWYSVGKYVLRFI